MQKIGSAVQALHRRASDRGSRGGKDVREVESLPELSCSELWSQTAVRGMGKLYSKGTDMTQSLALLASQDVEPGAGAGSSDKTTVVKWSDGVPTAADVETVRSSCDRLAKQARRRIRPRAQCLPQLVSDISGWLVLSNEARAADCTVCVLTAAISSSGEDGVFTIQRDRSFSTPSPSPSKLLFRTESGLLPARWVALAEDTLFVYESPMSAEPIEIISLPGSTVGAHRIASGSVDAGNDHDSPPQTPPHVGRSSVSGEVLVSRVSSGSSATSSPSANVSRTASGAGSSASVGGAKRSYPAHILIDLSSGAKKCVYADLGHESQPSLQSWVVALENSTSLHDTAVTTAEVDGNLSVKDSILKLGKAALADIGEQTWSSVTLDDHVQRLIDLATWGDAAVTTCVAQCLHSITASESGVKIVATNTQLCHIIYAMVMSECLEVYSPALCALRHLLVDQSFDVKRYATLPVQHIVAMMPKSSDCAALSGCVVLSSMCRHSPDAAVGALDAGVVEAFSNLLDRSSASRLMPYIAELLVILSQLTDIHKQVASNERIMDHLLDSATTQPEPMAGVTPCGITPIEALEALFGCVGESATPVELGSSMSVKDLIRLARIGAKVSRSLCAEATRTLVVIASSDEELRRRQVAQCGGVEVLTETASLVLTMESLGSENDDCVHGRKDCNHVLGVYPVQDVAFLAVVGFRALLQESGTIPALITVALPVLTKMLTSKTTERPLRTEVASCISELLSSDLSVCVGALLQSGDVDQLTVLLQTCNDDTVLANVAMVLRRVLESDGASALLLRVTKQSLLFETLMDHLQYGDAVLREHCAHVLGVLLAVDDVAEAFVEACPTSVGDLVTQVSSADPCIVLAAAKVLSAVCTNSSAATRLAVCRCTKHFTGLHCLVRLATGQAGYGDSPEGRQCAVRSLRGIVARDSHGALACERMILGELSLLMEVADRQVHTGALSSFAQQVSEKGSWSAVGPLALPDACAWALWFQPEEERFLGSRRLAKTTAFLRHWETEPTVPTRIGKWVKKFVVLAGPLLLVFETEACTGVVQNLVNLAGRVVQIDTVTMPQRGGIGTNQRRVLRLVATDNAPEIQLVDDGQVDFWNRLLTFAATTGGDKAESMLAVTWAHAVAEFEEGEEKVAAEANADDVSSSPTAQSPLPPPTRMKRIQSTSLLPSEVPRLASGPNRNSGSHTDPKSQLHKDSIDEGFEFAGADDQHKADARPRGRELRLSDVQPRSIIDRIIAMLRDSEPSAKVVVDAARVLHNVAMQIQRHSDSKALAKILGVSAELCAMKGVAPEARELGADVLAKLADAPSISMAPMTVAVTRRLLKLLEFRPVDAATCTRACRLLRCDTVLASPTDIGKVILESNGVESLVALRRAHNGEADHEVAVIFGRLGCVENGPQQIATSGALEYLLSLIETKESQCSGLSVANDQGALASAVGMGGGAGGSGAGSAPVSAQSTTPSAALTAIRSLYGKSCPTLRWPISVESTIWTPVVLDRNDTNRLPLGQSGIKAPFANISATLLIRLIQQRIDEGVVFNCLVSLLQIASLCPDQRPAILQHGSLVSLCHLTRPKTLQMFPRRGEDLRLCAMGTLLCLSRAPECIESVAATTLKSAAALLKDAQVAATGSTAQLAKEAVESVIDRIATKSDDRLERLTMVAVVSVLHSTTADGVVEQCVSALRAAIGSSNADTVTPLAHDAKAIHRLTCLVERGGAESASAAMRLAAACACDVLQTLAERTDGGAVTLALRKNRDNLVSPLVYLLGLDESSVVLSALTLIPTLCITRDQRIEVLRSRGACRRMSGLKAMTKLANGASCIDEHPQRQKGFQHVESVLVAATNCLRRTVLGTGSDARDCDCESVVDSFTSDELFVALSSGVHEVVEVAIDAVAMQFNRGFAPSAPYVALPQWRGKVCLQSDEGTTRETLVMKWGRCLYLFADESSPQPLHSIALAETVCRFDEVTTRIVLETSQAFGTATTCVLTPIDGNDDAVATLYSVISSDCISMAQDATTMLQSKLEIGDVLLGDRLQVIAKLAQHEYGGVTSIKATETLMLLSMTAEGRKVLLANVAYHATVRDLALHTNQEVAIFGVATFCNLLTYAMLSPTKHLSLRADDDAMLEKLVALSSAAGESAIPSLALHACHIMCLACQAGEHVVGTLLGRGVVGTLGPLLALKCAELDVAVANVLQTLSQSPEAMQSVAEHKELLLPLLACAQRQRRYMDSTLDGVGAQSSMARANALQLEVSAVAARDALNSLLGLPGVPSPQATPTTDAELPMSTLLWRRLPVSLIITIGGSCVSSGVTLQSLRSLSTMAVTTATNARRDSIIADHENVLHFAIGLLSRMRVGEIEDRAEDVVFEAVKVVGRVCNALSDATRTNVVLTATRALTPLIDAQETANMATREAATEILTDIVSAPSCVKQMLLANDGHAILMHAASICDDDLFLRVLADALHSAITQQYTPNLVTRMTDDMTDEFSAKMSICADTAHSHLCRTAWFRLLSAILEHGRALALQAVLSSAERRSQLCWDALRRGANAEVIDDGAGHVDDGETDTNADVQVSDLVSAAALALAHIIECIDPSDFTTITAMFTSIATRPSTGYCLMQVAARGNTWCEAAWTALEALCRNHSGSVDSSHIGPVGTVAVFSLLELGVIHGRKNIVKQTLSLVHRTQDLDPIWAASSGCLVGAAEIPFPDAVVPMLMQTRANRRSSFVAVVTGHAESALPNSSKWISEKKWERVTATLVGPRLVLDEVGSERRVYDLTNASVECVSGTKSSTSRLLVVEVPLDRLSIALQITDVGYRAQAASVAAPSAAGVDIVAMWHGYIRQAITEPWSRAVARDGVMYRRAVFAKAEDMVNQEDGK